MHPCDPVVWRSLTLALACPPFLYRWSDRAEIVGVLEHLHAAVRRMPAEHPAVPEIRAAAALVEEWLHQHPVIPDQRPGERGPVVWNTEIAWALIERWARIEPLFTHTPL